MMSPAVQLPHLRDDQARQAMRPQCVGADNAQELRRIRVRNAAPAAGDAGVVDQNAHGPQVRLYAADHLGVLLRIINGGLIGHRSAPPASQRPAPPRRRPPRRGGSSPPRQRRPPPSPRRCPRPTPRLDPVTKAIRPASDMLYFPPNLASRFSRNACTPSWKSAVAPAWFCKRASKSSCCS